MFTESQLRNVQRKLTQSIEQSIELQSLEDFSLGGYISAINSSKHWGEFMLRFMQAARNTNHTNANPG